jgi:hypothetical protein
MADGLLLDRKERLRVFWGKLAGGAGPPLALAGVVALLGGGAVAVSIAVVGALVGFVVATTARTVRGALIAGLVLAALLFAFQLVLAWFVTHPIQKE